MSKHTLLSTKSRNTATFRILLGRIMQIFIILALLAPAVMVKPASADDPDPIPGYLAQVSLTNLDTVVNRLVTDYGPRHSSFNRPYVDDICTVSSADPYPKNNYSMAADYIASLFTDMGYTVQRETISLNGGYTGDNIIVTKVGSLYPNDYIEVGAHLDSQPLTPGAGDDASGSTAIVEIARVLKDYPTKYSIRFLLYVGHEHGGYNQGSMYHLDQALARGERIKAGVMIDSIGWSDLDPACVEGYPSCTGLHSNDLWLNSSDAASMHIANIFAAVANDYSIPTYIDIAPAGATWSENRSYQDHGLPVVLSVGGTPYAAPGYHGTSPDGGCSDTLDKLNRQNISLSTQVNVGALLRLDAEPMITISGNAGAPGVTLSYYDGTNKTVTSDSSGAYYIPVLSNWSGTVTPSKPSYAFFPTSRTYTNVTVSLTAQDYTASTSDPIPGLIDQLSITNLTNTATVLVQDYGPRRHNVYSPFIGDICAVSTTVYPNSTIEMSSNYVRSLFLAMGYPESSITMENVPDGSGGSYGHNVYVTKIGSAYPNTYIEFGGHLDTQPGTPGGNDNASGSVAVIELARVLKDYPNRYSMRFAVWTSEELGTSASGALYHVQQALARGEKIKAGLNIDSVGWPDPSDPTGLMNEIWYNNAESQRIANIFNQVRTDYGIVMGFRSNAATTTSDERAYWNLGQTAVTSVGGWSTYRPNYHGCGDTVANIDFTNTLRTTQQNLAVGVRLDGELILPTITLTITPQSIFADSASTATAVATVLDGSGVPLINETVTFSTSGDVGISAVTNVGNGTYSVTLTASSTPGNETITATDNGVSAIATLTEMTYCPGYCFTDMISADFMSGSPGVNAYVSETTDGEIILAPTAGAEFYGSGSTLPTGWQSAAHGTGTPSVSLSGGWLTIDGAQVYTSDPTLYTSGRTIEYVANFGGGQFQAGGFSVNATTGPWAVFDFANDASNLAYWTSGSSAVNIPGNWAGTPHRYRIEWTASDIKYYIDGVLRATTITQTGSMRPIFTDNNALGPVNRVDWVRMSPYASSGTFSSRVFDGGGPADWGLVTWTADTPSGTGLTVSVRTGNTPMPDGSWSDFYPVINGGSIGAHARYMQYRTELSTSNPDVSPSLQDISLRYSPGTVGPPSKLGFVIQPTGAIAGAAFTTQPIVAVQDEAGYTIIDDDTTQVTLAIGTNPSGGTLTCTTNPVTVVNGVANFSGCRIDNSGSGYTLVASGGSLTSATSASFNVTSVPPASITLTLSPDTLSANGTSTSLAVATVRDAGGINDRRNGTLQHKR